MLMIKISRGQGWLVILHCKKYLRDSRIFFYQTFLGLGLGKLFPARESLASDIPAGDGNIAEPFFYSVVKERKLHTCIWLSGGIWVEVSYLNTIRHEQTG